jgi:2-polyprenyl-3-methyl-5-hydroxy-6-metoxy-1,4-benzoquinol methylase
LEKKASHANGGRWDPQEHYKETTIAKNYDAERFSGLRGKLYVGLEARALAKALSHVPNNSTIVDLPCGTGRLAQFLLARGYRVVGMDISPAMLEVARERLIAYGDRFTTQVTDVFSISDPKPVCDAALCARVLMHFPLQQQAAFLRGVASLTRGPILFTQSLITPYQRMRQRAKRILRVRSSVRHPLTPTQLDELLKHAHLTLEGLYWIARPISEAVVFVCRKADA